MNKVLLDQGLAPRTAELLRVSGWDAVPVIEAGLGSGTGKPDGRGRRP